MGAYIYVFHFHKQIVPFLGHDVGSLFSSNSLGGTTIKNLTITEKWKSHIGS